MANNIIELENVSFTYPGASKPAIKNINLSVRRSEILVVAGQSGCGKSTLLSHMKKNHIPFGKGSGNLIYIGSDGARVSIEEMSDGDSAALIGFVGQDTEAQIVCDRVWHELAFGMENLGFSNQLMRRRTAEIAEFMGIKEIYEKDTSEISGGERQLVLLASVMAMDPEILILDEPINQLSPRASRNFMNALTAINRELSTTVVITEQRLADVLPWADRVAVMEKGELVEVTTPAELGRTFAKYKEKTGTELAITGAIPAASRLYLKLSNDPLEPMPVSVREGRSWLKARLGDKSNLDKYKSENEVKTPVKGKAISLAVNAKELVFSYDGKTRILKKLSLKVEQGSFMAIMGGNGSGKTTLLKCLCGICKCKSGKVKLGGRAAYLTQNPKALFSEISVQEELAEVLLDKALGLSDKDIEGRVKEMLEILDLKECEKMHPYDLSGGQAQRLALGKVLLTEPDILMLDEPTKGLDAAFKVKLANILKSLQREGKTIILITHDMEFAAEYASHCAFMFNGDIVASDEKRNFFSQNLFFTTEVSRITRKIIDDCIVDDDVCKENLFV